MASRRPGTPRDTSPVATPTCTSISGRPASASGMVPLPRTSTRCSRGCPRCATAICTPTTSPGLGIDIDEDLAAKYPCQDTIEMWTQTRWPDGSPRASTAALFHASEPANLNLRGFRTLARFLLRRDHRTPPLDPRRMSPGLVDFHPVAAIIPPYGVSIAVPRKWPRRGKYTLRRSSIAASPACPGRAGRDQPGHGVSVLIWYDRRRHGRHWPPMEYVSMRTRRSSAMTST